MIKKLILPFVVLVILIFSIIFIGSKVSVLDDAILPQPSNIQDPDSCSDIMGTLEIFAISKESHSVISENRTVSMKQLNNNPYYLIIGELQKESDTCINPIDANVKVLSVDLKKNTLYLDFSKEFGKQDFSNGLDDTITQCISKSFLNLKEVHNVVIQVEGNTDWL